MRNASTKGAPTFRGGTKESIYTIRGSRIANPGVDIEKVKVDNIPASSSKIRIRVTLKRQDTLLYETDDKDDSEVVSKSDKVTVEVATVTYNVDNRESIKWSLYNM